MKNLSSLSRVSTIVALATLLIIAAATWDRSTRQVAAFNPQPDPPAFPLFAITHGQTARLNLVGVEDPNLSQPCMNRQVELMFVDAEGHTLLQQTATLVPGQGVALELNADLFMSEAGRMEIRGVVQRLRSCPGDQTKFKLLPSIEVFNNDGVGRTIFMVPVVQ